MRKTRPPEPLGVRVGLLLHWKLHCLSTGLHCYSLGSTALQLWLFWSGYLDCHSGERQVGRVKSFVSAQMCAKRIGQRLFCRTGLAECRQQAAQRMGVPSKRMRWAACANTQKCGDFCSELCSEPHRHCSGARTGRKSLNMPRKEGRNPGKEHNDQKSSKLGKSPQKGGRKTPEISGAISWARRA